MARRAWGIDLSRWQPTVDYNKAAESGVIFAVARASVGNYYTDWMFEEHFDGFKGAGVITGAYTVERPDNSTTSKMNRLMSALNGRMPDLPLAMDLEVIRKDNDSPPFPPNQINDSAQAYAEALEEEFGRKPIIYTARWVTWYMIENGVEPCWLNNYDIWVASYRDDAPILPHCVDDWKFWQTSSTGKVPGIVGNVDMNWFVGNAQELAEYANEDPEPPPPPPIPEPIICEVAGVEHLNVRNLPSNGGEVVRYLAAGDRVLIYDLHYGWARIHAYNPEWCWSAHLKST